MSFSGLRAPAPVDQSQIMYYAFKSSDVSVWGPFTQETVVLTSAVSACFGERSEVGEYLSGTRTEKHGASVMVPWTACLVHLARQPGIIL